MDAAYQVKVSVCPEFLSTMQSGPGRRLSTNEKMNRLINDRPASTDADAYRERNAEKAAKNRLRRGALYGAGARALIPKVKVSSCFF